MSEQVGEKTEQATPRRLEEAVKHGQFARSAEVQTALVEAGCALKDATAYKLKVTVKDTAGRESAGSVVQAVTRLPNPAGLSATPGSGKVTLTWNPVSSPHVKAYNLYRLASADPQTDIGTMTLIKNQAGTTWTDNSVINGTAYQYAVTTVTVTGAERAAPSPRAHSAASWRRPTPPRTARSSR